MGNYIFFTRWGMVGLGGITLFFSSLRSQNDNGSLAQAFEQTEDSKKLEKIEAIDEVEPIVVGRERWNEKPTTNRSLATDKETLSNVSEIQELDALETQQPNLGKDQLPVFPPKIMPAVDLNRNFEGIINIEELPSALIVIDLKNEEIAVAEANRLKIPVVALVDTNSDPSKVDFPIPGNDDAVKSIRIIIEVLMEAIIRGLDKRESKISKNVSKTVLPDATFEQEDDGDVTLPEGYNEEE